MRLRLNKQANQKLQESPVVVPKIFLNQGDTLEIGCGKGAMIIKMAQDSPKKQFYGWEKASSVLYQGVKKTEELGLQNLKFVLEDAEFLTQKTEGKCGEIWLSFPDPWPKLRHTKRRLTHQRFLKKYQQVLAPGGRLKIKTDSEKLYFFSLKHLNLVGASVVFKTQNLHASLRKTSNTLSNYESKWVKQGRSIFYIEAEFTKTLNPKTLLLKLWARIKTTKHDKI